MPRMPTGAFLVQEAVVIVRGIPSSTGAQPTAQDWDSLQAKLGPLSPRSAKRFFAITTSFYFKDPSRRLSTIGRRRSYLADTAAATNSCRWQPRPSPVRRGFPVKPNEAQTRLVANFQGRAVTPEEAAEVLNAAQYSLTECRKICNLSPLIYSRCPVARAHKGSIGRRPDGSFAYLSTNRRPAFLPATVP